MSIESQIDAAFKGTTREGRYPPGAYSNTHMLQDEYHGFAAGYLAALREALVISPGQMEVGMRAVSLVRGVGWREGLLGACAGSFKFGWIDKNSYRWISCQDCLHICRVCDWLPSPSDIFGRGE